MRLRTLKFMMYVAVAFPFVLGGCGSSISE